MRLPYLCVSMQCVIDLINYCLSIYLSIYLVRCRGGLSMMKFELNKMPNKSKKIVDSTHALHCIAKRTTHI